MRILAQDFINWDAIKEHHDLAMNPRHPHVQGTSQGPDIFFQCVEAGGQGGFASSHEADCCEAGNTFYDGLADLFEAKSRLVEQKTGRRERNVHLPCMLFMPCRGRGVMGRSAAASIGKCVCTLQVCTMRCTATKGTPRPHT